MTMQQTRNSRILQTRLAICWLLYGALVAPTFSAAAAHPAPGRRAQLQAVATPELDAGFHLLYQFEFEEARRQFDAWQKLHPNDPLGSASEAAAYLFEECHKQDILTAKFFLDDKRFL